MKRTVSARDGKSTVTIKGENATRAFLGLQGWSDSQPRDEDERLWVRAMVIHLAVLSNNTARLRAAMAESDSVAHKRGEIRGLNAAIDGAKTCETLAELQDDMRDLVAMRRCEVGEITLDERDSLMGDRAPAQTDACPVHAYQRHGLEAEELRKGIEQLMLGAGSTWAGRLQKLLDEVDARDSLAFLDRQAERKPKRARRSA